MDLTDDSTGAPSPVEDIPAGSDLAVAETAVTDPAVADSTGGTSVGGIAADGVPVAGTDEVRELDALEADMAAVEQAITTLDEIHARGVGGELAANEISAAVSEERFGR